MCLNSCEISLPELHHLIFAYPNQHGVNNSPTPHLSIPIADTKKVWNTHCSVTWKTFQPSNPLLTPCRDLTMWIRPLLPSNTKLLGNKGEGGAETRSMGGYEARDRAGVYSSLVRD